MAADPLQTFQITYAKLVSAGMTTGAAQLGAQTAMQAVLAQQNSKPPTVAISYQPVKSGRVPDPGPTSPIKRSR